LMWGVFSAAGLLLGQFRDYDAALIACWAWQQAVEIRWMGSTRLDR